MIRTNMHFTQKHLEQLRARKDKTGLTMAEQVRRAIDYYFGRVLEAPSVDVVGCCPFCHVPWSAHGNTCFGASTSDGTARKSGE